MLKFVSNSPVFGNLKIELLSKTMSLLQKMNIMLE